MHSRDIISLLIPFPIIDLTSGKDIFGLSFGYEYVGMWIWLRICPPAFVQLYQWFLSEFLSGFLTTTYMIPENLLMNQYLHRICPSIVCFPYLFGYLFSNLSANMYGYLYANPMQISVYPCILPTACFLWA